MRDPILPLFADQSAQDLLEGPICALGLPISLRMIGCAVEALSAHAGHKCLPKRASEAWVAVVENVIRGAIVPHNSVEK